MKQPLVLIGGGGHCKACIDVIEQEEKYDILGIIDKTEKKTSRLLGYPYLGTDEGIPSLCDRNSFFFITLGQIKSSKRRRGLFETVRRYGGQFPSILSPFAYCSPRAVIGEGTVLLHRAVVNSGAEIGENCIINTGSIIEHDVVIGSHNHVSTGAILNGGVTVGENSFIGSRAMVREGVKIGDNVIIGAGACVFNNVPSGTIVKSELKSKVGTKNDRMG